LLAREPVTFTTRVSCNTFASLVCAPVTSTNQFNRDKSYATFKWLLHPSRTTMPYPSMTSLLPRSSWLFYPSQINSRKAQQMTALQSSVLSQMTIPQLKVLCSFTSQ
jgi:hypothetical protein